ncbi:hypothetical protein DB346_02645 [Verrucomicrobia bacterium LW23]|nr:hypothetical protein DB346_04010 [Verrucomicrobia bacterium LW23]PTY04347.1 hypothetical protein DB346_02645 [Verrucomicrobia bacterium LW23]
MKSPTVKPAALSFLGQSLKFLWALFSTYLVLAVLCSPVHMLIVFTLLAWDSPYPFFRDCFYGGAMLCFAVLVFLHIWFESKPTQQFFVATLSFILCFGTGHLFFLVTSTDRNVPAMVEEKA